MIGCLFLLLYVILIDAGHFNGGTIRWMPVNPYDNSSSITITIIQSYWWTYPLINCTTNVPISTAVYSSIRANLTCIADCLTDGGYSNNSISILTDCSSASSSLGLMISERAVSVTITSGAHFYVAYVGTAWRTLSNLNVGGVAWSIASFIDLRFRSDGFINTPPLARVVSPQYVIVNTTTQIQISVSDVNIGDDLRCRWSTNSINPTVNECASVCYPASVPQSTTLSNCTISFQGPTAGIWYGAAIQVEDFINTTSTTAMSSVPVQFLIYVIPVPVCSTAPVFLPITGCLEATTGVAKTVDIYVLNLCNSTTINIADIFITYSTTGMQLSNLTQSPTNSSLFYKTLTWIPQANQIGPQQLCLVAYTTEFVQSNEYCDTFIGITSLDPCATTTTSTTTTSTSTSATTSTATTITDTVATTSAPGQGPSWGLIAGIASLALPLALCSCYCLYRLLGKSGAKREQQQEEEEAEERRGYRHISPSGETILQTSSLHSNENSQIEVPKKSYQVYNIAPKEENANRDCSSVASQGSILISMYNNNVGRHHMQESLEMGNAWMEPPANQTMNDDMPMNGRASLPVYSVREMQAFKPGRHSFNISNQLNVHENTRSFTAPPFVTDHFSISQSHLETIYQVEQSQRLTNSSFNFKEWSGQDPLLSERKGDIHRT